MTALMDIVAVLKGDVYSYALMINWSMVVLTIACFSLFMILCYWLVACYIQLINLDLKLPNLSLNETNDSSNFERLKHFMEFEFLV